MRSALALSALLLLLPPRSLSQEESTPASGTVIGTTDLQNTDSRGTVSATSKEGSTALKTVPNTIVTSREQVTTAAATGGSPIAAPSSSGPTPRSSGPTAAPAQQSTSLISPGPDGKVSRNPTGNSTVTTGGPKDTQGLSKMPLTLATTAMKPETKDSQTAGAGAQGSSAVTTSPWATKGGEQAAPTSPGLLTTFSPTSPLPAVTVTPSPLQPTRNPAASEPPVSPSKGPDQIPTVVSNSSGTKAGPSSTLHGTPTTPTSLPTSQGNLQNSSTVPAAPGASSSAPGASSSAPGASSSAPGASSSTPGTPSAPGTTPSEAPQPISPSSGPVTTSPAEGYRSSSPQLTSVASRVSNIPSSSSAPADDRIKCESPKRLTDKMLILNLTKTSLCAGNSSLEDKLVTLLCRAAKSTFTPTKDECHIWLVPDQDSQAVAIREITMKTKLLPGDVYESLKDKWDELKEVGVSNMQLGDQGPPEETEDRFSMPLIITIVCMASFLLLVAALYGCCHQRLSQRKDQQRLTEELQTVENGYHDNPTLEVMETSSEMQEKKVVNLNGELGDSWIVPLDNLAKDDLDEEEDTHL